MDNPVISVVVPVYNVEKYLHRCVDSLLNQSFESIEVLLIDDGATDSSGSICDDYAVKDKRVRVVHKENGGLSDARNAALDRARGKYICFVDSDDFLEPQALQKLYQLLIENNADISVCGVRDCFEGKEYRLPVEEEQFVLSGIEALRETLEGRKLAGTVCNKLIRQELCEKIRFVKGKTYEDAFYMPDLLLQAQKVAVTTTPLYNYWHRLDSITTKPFSQKNMDVIDAYVYTLQTVQERCPELVNVAMFRLYWAYFVVLDKMLVVSNYKILPQYQEIILFLRSNWLKIATCSYFRKSRRVAAVILKASVEGYRYFALRKLRKYKANN